MRKSTLTFPQMPAVSTMALRLLTQKSEKRLARIAVPQIEREPLSKGARAYFKALREAELAAWNRSIAPRPSNLTAATTKVPARKRVVNPSGSWVLWIWAICVGLTLLQNLHGTASVSAHWQHITTVLAQFLG